MTKKDFFIIALKLFGLYSAVISLFTVIPSNVSFIMINFEIESILWLTLVTVLVLSLFVFLVFKSEKLVEVLNLEKGFDDERIELGSLSTHDILKLGSFIIGGLLFLESLPSFLSHSYLAFKSDVSGMEYQNLQKFNWAVSCINLILGFFLFSNYDFVASKLKSKSKDSDDS